MYFNKPQSDFTAKYSYKSCAASHCEYLLFPYYCSHCLVCDYRGRWWEQWAAAFPSHNPEDWSKEPTSRLSPFGPHWPPVMWEKAGRVSCWVCWGGCPRLQTYHCCPVSGSISQAKPRLLKIVCFVSVCICCVVSPCFRPNRNTTQVAVGISELQLH